jgi:hypothetical protein
MATMLKHLLTAALALGLTAQAADARLVTTRPAAVTVDRAHRAQRAKLRTILAERRATNVAAFRAYVVAGVYPHNDLRDTLPVEDLPLELNIWIDGEGHRCAAAQMIWASGAHSLVEQQAAADNYIRLANVTDGPLMDWILTSGLTQDEVVLIQRPFRRPPPQHTAEWRTKADRAMRVKYDGIVRELARSQNASLDAAVDALVAHPDLVKAMLG